MLKLIDVPFTDEELKKIEKYFITTEHHMPRELLRPILMFNKKGDYSKLSPAAIEKVKKYYPSSIKNWNDGRKQKDLPPL